MPQPMQDKRGILLPNPGNPNNRFASEWRNGDRPSGGVLIASAALNGDGNQQFAASNVNWQTGAWSGGSINRSNGYIALTNPANQDGGVYSLVGIECFGLGLRDYYLEFEVKYPGFVWGSKFCKFHGAADGSGNGANCTFGQNNVGDLNYIGFGDGVELGQDVNQMINLGIGGDIFLGRNAGIAEMVVPPIGIYPWQSFSGNVWRKFRVHAKFNTGTTAVNEIPDGEFYLEIDGVVYLHIRGIYNRHYLNPPVSEINIGGWTAGGSQPFELDVRNVKISTGDFIE